MSTRLLPTPPRSDGDQDLIEPGRSRRERTSRARSGRWLSLIVLTVVIAGAVIVWRPTSELVIVDHETAFSDRGTRVMPDAAAAQHPDEPALGDDDPRPARGEVGDPSAVRTGPPVGESV